MVFSPSGRVLFTFHYSGCSRMCVRHPGSLFVSSSVSPFLSFSVWSNRKIRIANGWAVLRRQIRTPAGAVSLRHSSSKLMTAARSPIIKLLWVGLQCRRFQSCANSSPWCAPDSSEPYRAGNLQAIFWCPSSIRVALARGYSAEFRFQAAAAYVVPHSSDFPPSPERK